ncbi:MAG: hypothetical protein J6R47_03115 [Acholeplasmatales bacterium]|nr:hypothetical protein [Acholeplasmatales bacterium]
MPLGSLISLIALAVFFIAYMIVRFFHIKIAAIILKTLTSLSFVMIAVFSKEKMLFDTFAYITTIVALSIGCASDIVIQFRRYIDNSKTKFILMNVGFGLYALEIMLLNLVLVNMSVYQKVESITWQTIAALASTIVILILANVFGKKREYEFGKFELQANLYLLVLAFVAFISIYLFISGSKTLLFMLGMISFVLSNIFLIAIYFGGKNTSKVIVLLNNIFYYGAQTLLALSLLYVIA